MQGPAAEVVKRSAVAWLVVAAISLALAAVTFGAGPPPDPAVAVATVGDGAVARTTFDHWLRVDYHRNALKGTPRCPLPSQRTSQAQQMRKETMTFLIRAQWLEGEAAERSVKVTRSEVRRSVAAARRQAFPHQRDFQRFLRSACETLADVQFRKRQEILQRRVLADAAKHGESIESFFTAYQDKWRSRTVCADGFTLSDCSNAT